MNNYGQPIWTLYFGGGADPRDAEEAAAAQTGIAGTGVTVLASIRAATNVAPPPPPATAGAYAKKDAGGPTALIAKLKNELKMEIEADAKDETYAQEDYEELMKESAEKRAADSKTITEKESQKAGLEGELDSAKKEKKATATDLMALGEYIASLHGSCDFLLENFEVRACTIERTPRISKDFSMCHRFSQILRGFSIRI